MRSSFASGVRHSSVFFMDEFEEFDSPSPVKTRTQRRNSRPTDLVGNNEVKQKLHADKTQTQRMSAADVVHKHFHSFIRSVPA